MKLLYRRGLLFILCFLMACPSWAVMNRSQALKELGITNPKFTEKELKSAYRRRSLETHPDKGGSNEEFVRVAEAYDLLNGGDNSSKFSGFDGSSAGGKNSEEAMRQAEEMFFEMFEDMLDGQAVDLLFEKIFGDPAKHSWSQRQFMGVLKSMTKGFINKIADALMSDSVQFNVNGQTMTGADLKKWRDKMRERKKGVNDKSSKSDL